MALGPGKYDYLCTFVRENAKAKGALVIILDGDKGSGFSCQADLAVALQLPEMLENIAKQIRESEPLA